MITEQNVCNVTEVKMVQLRLLFHTSLNVFVIIYVLNEDCTSMISFKYV